MSILSLALLLATPAPVQAAVRNDDLVEINGRILRRCGTAQVDPDLIERPASDCTLGQTVISAEYDPVAIYDIPVVIHVIQHTNGDGFVSMAQAQRQIEILNEDFKAIAGTNGANGFNSMIQFHLATEDPQGNPTTGVTYSTNNTWFNDGGSYWNSLSWDPDNYMNLYSNSASGNLGYVPGFPQQLAGNSNDRVVCYWEAVGDTGFSPYHRGRTATHEVGHYLGLYHTFQGGCDSGGCFTDGDLICDTNDESGPNFGCNQGSSSCSSTDPVGNYMNYSDDLCMDKFTSNQSNRMRCAIQHYRPDLPETAGPPVANFTASPLTGEKPLNVSFNDVSNGSVTSWDWTFGDGNTSTLENPNHVYQNAGLYTVSLTVNGPNGGDSHTEVDLIDVLEGPPASFVYENGGGSNPFAFINQTLPIVGTNWETSVAMGTATSSFVAIGYRGPANINVPRGEVLFKPPSLKPVDQSTGLHSIPVANDVALVGETFWTQAARKAPGFPAEFLNAIYLTVGY